MMRFTAGHKYARILSLGAKHLARHYPDNVGEWLTFLIEQDRYNVQMRGIWYDLLVLVQYNYLKETDTVSFICYIIIIAKGLILFLLQTGSKYN